MKRSLLRRLGIDAHGSAMVEMALVFPLLLTLTFAILEFGNAFYQWLIAEKATEMGVRFAVTAPIVATGLSDCGAATTATAGTPCRQVAGSDGWTRTCTSGSASGCDATAFTAIVAKMQAIYPRIAAANVTVQYSGTGLGFVGRGSPVPNVTVSLSNLTFDFVVLNGLLGLGQIAMPDFRATLTGEDLS
ncbi:TadE/TadG family type IV pilus assembly protein [Azospirillum canadense]|uniref:TadE/TadG family type IV pilus assembly protein n=1 Tax=Azospirillum canadense TaxID=403962 RepID=UPI002225F2F2|nr:TadE family protein [Azospirillum canadense]MCW2238708.1 Flp pilus assembly protein TadG [Azospirillum canadense]